MLKKKKWEKLFDLVATQLSQDNPGMSFEVFDDDGFPGGFAIGVLSTGPDYAPDLQEQLPPAWRFLGWRNPEQRNNMSTIVMTNGMEEKV